MDLFVLLIAFITMLSLMLLSIPVAVSILAVGAVGGYLAYGVPLISMMGGVIFSSLNNTTMLAIPLFMLLGELLLRSGIADRMYDALAVWLGRLPGGLLHTNIATCTLFSATSGSSVATAATVGTIALPTLNERKYPIRLSLGSIAAGGTLGILIPPSINLLVYGSIANVSVGQLFMAGIMPGLLLASCFCIYIFFSYRQTGSTVRRNQPAVKGKADFIAALGSSLYHFCRCHGQYLRGACNTHRIGGSWSDCGDFPRLDERKTHYVVIDRKLLSRRPDNWHGHYHTCLRPAAQRDDLNARGDSGLDELGCGFGLGSSIAAHRSDALLPHTGNVHGCDVDARTDGSDSCSSGNRGGC